jgi:DNA-binding transcriptional ArsR family regulator
MAKPRSHSAEFRLVLRTFALFGHPVRVVMFQRLARRPSTASDLARELPVSRVAVVQHLKRLEGAGLVRSSPDGRRRVYRIEPRGLDPLARWVLAHRDLPANRERA